ncbi:MAG: NusA-like transcription termination signal-binding factor [Candidatus Micrarchaeia archaeon]
MVTFSLEDIQLLNAVEAATGAKANDVVKSDNAFIIVVRKGELGKAIGKQGSNITRLRKHLGKDVFVVEDSDTMNGFLANVFAPVPLKAVNLVESEGRKIAVVAVEAKNKGLAIGRGGDKIKRARILAKRKFGIDEVKIQ